MNLLEHYIKEVYDVKTIDMRDGNGGWTYVEVDMMINCYGNGKRVQQTFRNMEEWEKAKEQGYYMA